MTVVAGLLAAAKVAVPGPEARDQFVVVAPVAVPVRVAAVPAMAAGAGPGWMTGAGFDDQVRVRRGRWVRVGWSSEVMRVKAAVAVLSVSGERSIRLSGWPAVRAAWAAARKAAEDGNVFLAANVVALNPETVERAVGPKSPPGLVQAVVVVRLTQVAPVPAPTLESLPLSPLPSTGVAASSRSSRAATLPVPAWLGWVQRSRETPVRVALAGMPVRPKERTPRKKFAEAADLPIRSWSRAPEFQTLLSLRRTVAAWE